MKFSENSIKFCVAAALGEQIGGDEVSVIIAANSQRPCVTG